MSLFSGGRGFGFANVKVSINGFHGKQEKLIGTLFSLNFLLFGWVLRIS